MFIFTEENIGDIKNAVYTNDGIKDKHAKKIEGIKDGLFKDFNYSKYKVKNPPKNTSMIVYNELQYLKDLPEDDKYVEENDDIEKVFEKVCKENNVEYPKELVSDLIKSAAGIVLDLKYIHNRPRPFQLASHYNLKLGEKVLESMKTPSYPSGHSAQGILVGKVLQTKLPINTDAFLEAGKRISYSRNIGRAHYPSDSKLGEDIGDAMFRHIRHKI
tara:strand:- start:37 stop:684 length:648 start_codon:yes stop_codon:yes gene_type:complete